MVVGTTGSREARKRLFLKSKREKIDMEKKIGKTRRGRKGILSLFTFLQSLIMSLENKIIK